MGLEFLIGAIVTLVTELLKRLNKKLELEVAKAVVVVGVFILSLIASLLYLVVSSEEIISLADWPTLLRIWAYATLFYCVVVKAIIRPVFKK